MNLEDNLLFVVKVLVYDTQKGENPDPMVRDALGIIGRVYQEECRKVGVEEARWRACVSWLREHLVRNPLISDTDRVYLTALMMRTGTSGILREHEAQMLERLTNQSWR